MKKRSVLVVVLCMCFSLLLCSCSNSSEETVVNSEGEITLSRELSDNQSKELLENSEYLPIGTVVTVGNETKKLMIIGLLQVKAENNQVYDYSAVLYPEGYIGPSETYLFNKNQISRIHHLGLVSNEQKMINESLSSIDK